MLKILDQSNQCKKTKRQTGIRIHSPNSGNKRIRLQKNEGDCQKTEYSGGEKCHIRWRGRHKKQGGIVKQNAKEKKQRYRNTAFPADDFFLRIHQPKPYLKIERRIRNRHIRNTLFYSDLPAAYPALVLYCLNKKTAYDSYRISNCYLVIPVSQLQGRFPSALPKT